MDRCIQKNIAYQVLKQCVTYHPVVVVGVVVASGLVRKIRAEAGDSNDDLGDATYGTDDCEDSASAVTTVVVVVAIVVVVAVDVVITETAVSVSGCCISISHAPCGLVNVDDVGDTST